MEKEKVNRPNNESMLSEEDAFKGKLEELKGRLSRVQQSLSGLNQCSHLSNLLQKIHEIRDGLNNLEQGLLQIHLKGCISPSIKVPEVVAFAVSKLSRKRRGGTIVIEQEDDLDDYFQGGTTIDAVVSAPILENIFYPGSPLHDGAVLIRDARIIKAGCLLPFAPHPYRFEALGLGTRHAAAVGLSKASDALVIVVSEEKGWISLALKGQLYPNLGTFALLQRLEGSMEEESRSNTQ
jgi:DNA integrity scanning protein DisA with diadenylate cyclase activity